MPRPRCRPLWRASVHRLPGPVGGFGHHLDRVHRALLEAGRAAGAAVVVEAVPVPGTELDHRVLRARAEAAVALEAVAAGQAAAGLVARLAGGQPPPDPGEPR